MLKEIKRKHPIQGCFRYFIDENNKRQGLFKHFSDNLLLIEEGGYKDSIFIGVWKTNYHITINNVFKDIETYKKGLSNGIKIQITF